MSKEQKIKSISVEDRIEQIIHQMEGERIGAGFEPGVPSEDYYDVAMHTIVSYAVHLEGRVVALEAAMDTLMQSLMVANESFESKIAKQPQGIIMPGSK